MAVMEKTFIKPCHITKVIKGNFVVILRQFRHENLRKQRICPPTQGAAHTK
jgi:hypothetical protein